MYMYIYVHTEGFLWVNYYLRAIRTIFYFIDTLKYKYRGFNHYASTCISAMHAYKPGFISQGPWGAFATTPPSPPAPLKCAAMCLPPLEQNSE